MNKEESRYFEEENISEALNRFKSSLVSGRKNYFDVSEFEKIVDYLLDEGDINSSEIAARQGIQIHPGAIQLKLKYAQVLINKGQYESALNYIRLAEAIEPDNSDVHLIKGTVTLIMGDRKKAEKSFMRALRTGDEEKDDILYNIGAAYLQIGDTASAVSYFEKALLVNPENEMALYDLGFFSDQDEDFQKSIDYYNRYLDNDPFNYSVWFNLGISYNKLGDFGKAIEAYEYALALNENFIQALFNIGNSYANIGKFHKAIAKYLEFLEFEPDNDDALCYIGECYLNLEDYSHSEYYYHKAIKANKDNDNAWFGLGLIMWVEKKLNESIVFIKKAIKIESYNSEYWLTLAKVCSDFGKPEDAGKALKKASKLEPENSEIWLTWADLWIRYGELVKSIRVIGSAIRKNDDVILKYRMVSLFLENKQGKEAEEILLTAMRQDLSQISYLYDIYPKALKNKRISKLVHDFRTDSFIK